MPSSQLRGQEDARRLLRCASSTWLVSESCVRVDECLTFSNKYKVCTCLLGRTKGGMRACTEGIHIEDEQ